VINEKFENYFSEIRKNWPELRQALLQDEKQIGFSSFQHSLQEILKNPDAYPAGDSQKRTTEGFLENYVMDPASLLPVYALDLEKNHNVLDLCAAPGGKSLAILGQIPNGGLVANDSSKDRFLRLKKVLKEYSPESAHPNYKTTLGDGRTFFKTKEVFDRVLVDVPCSSERHLLKNEKHLALWTPKQAESLAIKQYTLLCTALLCTEPQGLIVYSTCSINPVENDQVIAKALKKKGDQCELDLPNIDFLGAQKTDYGYWISPTEQGFGPIYLSRLRRT
jgi:16S rRNA C967 or C1407 C5-methylase (RsmB/RsmF family)